MVNKVVFQGNVVRDPELVDTRSQTSVLNFTLANSRKFKDKTDTAFVDCTAFGQIADTIYKYFIKGNPIIVEGRIAQNTWEAQDGSKRSKLYIVVEGFHFAGQTGGTDNDSEPQNRSNQRDNRRGGNRGGRGGNGGSRSRGRQDSGQQKYNDDIPF